MVHVIRLMVRVNVRQVGMVHYALTECAPIICMVNYVHQYVNVIKIIRICVIRGRENVIVKLVGLAVLAIDHAHSQRTVKIVHEIVIATMEHIVHQ